jgi:hypothetical protein
MLLIHNTYLRIRILLFTLMRIRIPLFTGADPTFYFSLAYRPPRLQCEHSLFQKCCGSMQIRIRITSPRSTTQVSWEKIKNYGKLLKFKNQCCESGMLIPDPNFFHPGFLIHIRIKDFKYFNPKKVLSSRKYDPGCSSRIRILIFYPSWIPDPGVKKAPDPGPGSATL